MLTSGLFSSNSELWGTPQELFNALDKEFNFTLDVCATPELSKCKRYFDPETDGLKQNWDNERCFLNPPYGKKISEWVKKASLARGGVVVALLPARTDTRWFKSYVEPYASEIRFIAGRLKFTNPNGKAKAAPFPSMIAIYGTPRTPRYNIMGAY